MLQYQLKDLSAIIFFFCTIFNPALYKQKYSLSKFEDEDVGKLIIQSITVKSKKKRLNAFRDLANLFWNKTGGFEINTFEFKSATDI